MVVVIADPITMELGQSTNLIANASGGTGNYNYSWEPKETLSDPSIMNPIATPVETGIAMYTVIVNDGESTVSNQVEVMVSEPVMFECPSPNNFVGEDYYDEGDIGARLMWDKANYEFSLDRFEIYRSESGSGFELVRRIVNTPSITHYETIDFVDTPGLYYYRIVAFYQNNCESDYVEITVDVTGDDAVGENIAENVSLYPNPSSGKVNVKAEAMRRVTVVNVTGQVVMIQDVDNDEVVIDMSSFDDGMYIVNINTDKGNVVKMLNILR